MTPQWCQTWLENLRTGGLVTGKISHGLDFPFPGTQFNLTGMVAISRRLKGDVPGVKPTNDLFFLTTKSPSSITIFLLTFSPTF